MLCRAALRCAATDALDCTAFSQKKRYGEDMDKVVETMFMPTASQTLGPVGEQ